MEKKKAKPKFNVPNFGSFKSVKKRWRKPRGTANKKRMKYRFMGSLPKIGYKNAPAVRGRHPSGRREVLISSMAQLEGVSPINGDLAVRMAAGLGAKKRKELEDKAKLMKLFIVNMRFDGKAEKEGRGKAPKNQV